MHRCNDGFPDLSRCENSERVLLVATHLRQCKNCLQIARGITDENLAKKVSKDISGISTKQLVIDAIFNYCHSADVDPFEILARKLLVKIEDESVKHRGNGKDRPAYLQRSAPWDNGHLGRRG